MRIASLLASGTEIAFSLGLGESVVGISHECDYPADAMTRPRLSRPRFETAGRSSAEIDAALRGARERYGSVYALDHEQLRRLAPDLVLTQAVCDVCAVPTSLATEAARALDRETRILSLDAHTVDEILRCIAMVGEAAGVPDQAEALVREGRRRIEAVRGAVGDAEPPSVLAIEWLAPPFLPGHWVPEMIELAGGIALGAESALPSRQGAWTDLRALDPDVLIIMPCGYDLAVARADADAHSAQLASVAPRAIADGRAWVVDGSAYFNRSGPRVVEGIEILGALLHPTEARGADLTGRAERWQPGL
jgi:iron complex transport system substrate-binding protein